MNTALDNKRGFFIVISAPSGTGKSTLCKELIKRHPFLQLSVSFTSRAPRAGEIDGREYYFISREDFLQKITVGDFIEWVENYGNFYGTSKATTEKLLQEGIEIIFDTEPRGAKTIKENLSGGALVFIMPPSLKELQKRLLGRKSESPEQTKIRLAQAQQEISESVWYDYIIVNDNLEQAVAQLEAIYLALKNQ